MQDEEDRAWQAIVENYGDRAEIDDAEATSATSAPAEPDEALEPDAVIEPDRDEEHRELAEDPEDRFIPPNPRPVPLPAPDRMLAWVGLFGAPAVMLFAAVFGISLPGIVALLLVGAFVGGFLYLVSQMPRDPRDPWDDGAQV